MDFTLYDKDNAPEESKELLNSIENQFGFVPNLMKVLAASPAALKAYIKLEDVISESSFTREEQEIVRLAASVENECNFCTSAHSGALKSQLGTDENTVYNIIKGETLNDKKLNTLVNYVRSVVRDRGHVSETDLNNFTDAGYTKAQVFEVNAIVAQKTLSNYTNHIADTPLNEEMEEAKPALETA